MERVDCIVSKMIRESLMEKMKFEQCPKGGEAIGQAIPSKEMLSR